MFVLPELYLAATSVIIALLSSWKRWVFRSVVYRFTDVGAGAGKVKILPAPRTSNPGGQSRDLLQTWGKKPLF